MVPSCSGFEPNACDSVDSGAPALSSDPVSTAHADSVSAAAMIIPAPINECRLLMCCFLQARTPSPAFGSTLAEASSAPQRKPTFECTHINVHTQRLSSCHQM